MAEHKLIKSKEKKIADRALELFLRHGYRKVTMSNIAEACAISRPSLYAVFSNKEAVLTSLINRQTEETRTEADQRLTQNLTLKNKLECLFELWIILPVASVLESENGLELVANCESYAPQAVENLYAQFERQLARVIEPEIKKPLDLSAEDLAHIMALATKGLKASTETLAELRRLSAGLIAITIAALA